MKDEKIFLVDAFEAVLTRLESYQDEFERLATTKDQKLLAEDFKDVVREVADVMSAAGDQLFGRKANDRLLDGYALREPGKEKDQGRDR